MGLFQQHFLKTIFDFGNMWQLRIWYLDIDGLRARRKILNCTKATWKAFHTCCSLPVSRSQLDFLTKKKSVTKKWSWENCLHVLSLPNRGNSATSEVARPPDLTDKASYRLDVIGPCMDLSVHVPNGYIKDGFPSKVLTLRILTCDFALIRIQIMYWSRRLIEMNGATAERRFRRTVWSEEMAFYVIEALKCLGKPFRTWKFFFWTLFANTTSKSDK